MRTPTALLAALLMLLPVVSLAQTDEELDTELGLRLSAAAEKKIMKGLHVRLEEEVRLDNNFSSLDRLQTTLGVAYKVHPNIKVGAGYALLLPYSDKSSAFKGARSRFMADVTGTLRFGEWTLSLKERLQVTRRAGAYNEYETPSTTWGLKSRLMLKYKGWQRKRVVPYGYVELRNTFSGPTVSADYNSSTGTYFVPGTSSTEGEAGWFLDGFNGTYVNRVRGCVGVDYRLSKRNSVSVNLLADYVSDKVVDANKSGTALKSYTRQTGFFGSLCAGYTYSF